MTWFRNRERPTRRSAVSMVAIVVAAMLLTSSRIGAQVGSGSALGGDLGHRGGRPAADRRRHPRRRRPQSHQGSLRPPRRRPRRFCISTTRRCVRSSARALAEIACACMSNTFGTAPLTIGAAHVALRDKESAIAPVSDRALTFSGRPTITIPSGAVVYSDPVALDIPALADLAVDIYLPGNTNTPSPVTMHNGARQTSYVSQTGNHAGIARCRWWRPRSRGSSSHEWK